MVTSKQKSRRDSQNIKKGKTGHAPWKTQIYKRCQKQREKETMEILIPSYLLPWINL